LPATSINTPKSGSGSTTAGNYPGLDHFRRVKTAPQ